MATKLKAKEIAAYREKAILQQRGTCPLCEEPLISADACLDHCHVTGHVRQALHRSCNSAEGRVLNWAGPRSRGDDPVLFLTNLLKYWASPWDMNPLHHTHGAKKRKRKRKTKTRKTNGRK